MNPGVVSATDYTSVASINIFVALLCACIVIGHLLEEHRWINEAITALVIVFGLITKPLVGFLLPPSTDHSSSITLSFTSEPSSPPRSYLSMLLAFGQESQVEEEQTVPPPPPDLRMILTAPSRSVHHYWRKFDDKFMRPVFGGRGFVPFVPGSPTERSLHPYQPSKSQQEEGDDPPPLSPVPAAS
ncbi:hypothetical protein GW17_00000025 [Ensete ventricosum]|nr:hypothetical protein GW17_00000025 [Ensete ventricosum]